MGIKGSQIIKTSECGLPNDLFGRLTSVTLVLIIKNKLGSAQVLKFGRLLVKIDSSAVLFLYETYCFHYKLTTNAVRWKR